MLTLLCSDERCFLKVTTLITVRLHYTLFVLHVDVIQNYVQVLTRHIRLFAVPLLLQNNVAMLLETNYRERLHMVTNEVKRRLDYQIALQHLNRRMQQEHMINWVEKNVISSITPQQVSPSPFFLFYEKAIA